MPDSADVAAAVDAVESAYREAAASTVDAARLIADARRRLAAVLTPAERAPFTGTTRISDADRAELHALAVALELPSSVSWTPAEWLRVLRAAPDSLAELIIARWQEDAGDAMRCWEQAHQAQLDRLRKDLLEATLAHGCGEHRHERIDLG